MSNQRIVNLAYFVFAIIVFVVLNQLLGQFWALYQIYDQKLLGSVGVPMLISLVTISVAMFVLMRHERVNPFLLEVVGELREVTWPTRQETISHTRVVIIMVLVMAVILGAFDAVWAKLSKFILNPNI